MRTLADWLTYISTQHHEEIALGLARSAMVATRLQLLPLAPRNLIVAGTNGKGSTVRFAESLLLAQGCSVGATLSPHLHRYNERVRLNGCEATDAELVAAFTAVEQGRGDVPLTYYEYSVLGAFWLFKQANLDVCVLEVGLGGRLDTINLVDAEVAAITSIGLDHQNFLGDTLDEIGAEKAAVCRSGKPLLLGGAMPASVRQVAADTGAEVTAYGEEYWYQRSATGATVRLAAGATSLRCAGQPKVAWRNATLAMAAVSRLTRAPSEAELNSAVTNCGHPGRFEELSFRGRTLVLDVAHNPASAKFLRQQLQQRWAGCRMVACVGFLADKDVGGIVAELAAEIAHWVFVPTGGARALTAEAAADQAAGPLGAVGRVADQWFVEQTVAAGLARAHALADKADIIVAFGSFLQVQRVREILLPAERSLTTNTS